MLKNDVNKLLILVALISTTTLLHIGIYKQISLILFLPILFLLEVIVLYAWYFKNSTENELLIFSLVMISLLFTRFFFAAKYSSLIGTDAIFHLDVAENIIDVNGHILFNEYKTTSFSFVGLYVLYNSISNIISIPIDITAKYLHPIINLITISMLYIIARKTTNREIALFAIFIYGWNFYTFWYGYEFRTENLALLYLLMLLFFIFTKKDLPITILILICIFSIFTTHFVTSLHTLIALCLFISIDMYNHNKPQEKILFLVSAIIFVCYLLYVSENFTELINYVSTKIYEGVAEREFSGESKSAFVGTTYNSIAFLGNWLYRLLFFLGLYTIYKANKKYKYNIKAKLFFIFWSLILLSMVFATLIVTSTLSSPRIYGFFIVPSSIIIGYGIYYFKNQFFNWYHNRLNPKYIAICFVVFIMMTASIFQYPIFTFTTVLYSNSNEEVYDLLPELTSIEFIHNNELYSIEVDPVLNRLYNMEGFYSEHHRFLDNDSEPFFVTCYISYPMYSNKTKKNHYIYTNQNEIIGIKRDLNQTIFK